MLLRKQKDSYLLYLNDKFYDIDQIISANTRFDKDFDTNVQFTIINLPIPSYHIIELFPKRSGSDIHGYINRLLK